MKPLYARWIPAMVSEQPVSASEDKRVLGHLTGLALLTGGLTDEEKALEQAQERRDTAVAGLARSQSLKCHSTEMPARPERSRSVGLSTSTHASRHA